MKDPTASYRRAASVSATAPNPTSRSNAVGLSAAVLSAFLVVAATGSASAQTTSGVSPAESAAACATPGGWIDVKTGRSIDRVELFRDLVAKSAVVLLGESHTEADDHRWQLQTLAALHGRGANLVIRSEEHTSELQSLRHLVCRLL